ncbi:hypothetical protein HKD37_15G043103 [Glycine soja]
MIIMSEEVDMNVENEEDAGVKVEHVNCSDAFNTSQLFASRDEVLYWDRSGTHDIGFVAVIMRSDTNTGVRGRTSFLLIACKRSGEYRPKKNDLLSAKLVLGGEGWMVKLICGVHNHEMTKSLVGHSYAGRLTKDKKIVVADMTKSMVKLRNILLMLKEHNANSYTTIKQIYNAKHAYPSSIRGSNTEMQQLMILLDAVKLTNSCNLIFLIDSTYKTNRYKLSLLDIVGVTPTGMAFSIAFAYLEGERLNNVIQALQSFRGLLIRVDALPGVIITDRDLSLMNAVKTLFLDATNLLCRAKPWLLKRMHGDYVMEAWGSLVDCPCESSFDEYLKNFEMACSPWPMFVDYVCQSWVISHKEKFVKAWTNKVMHLGNTTTNRVEGAHWSLKRLLQNSPSDICSVWEAMNNMMTLQHTQIKTSFETSTQLPCTIKLLGMVSRHALNEIAAEYERVPYAGKNPSRCGCVMRSTHDLPCAYELLSFLDQGLCEAQVTITEKIETILKHFEQLDVCGKVHLKTKLREIAYPDLNSMCPPLEKVKTKDAPKKPLTKQQKSTKHDPSY